MIRFVKIKEILSGVHFSSDEAPYVIEFMEKIGIKSAKNYVVDSFIMVKTGTQIKTHMTYIKAHQFFEECIGHKIGEMFSLETATKIAIEEYLYQVNELRSKYDPQEQIDKEGYIVRISTCSITC